MGAARRQFGCRIMLVGDALGHSAMAVGEIRVDDPLLREQIHRQAHLATAPATASAGVATALFGFALEQDSPTLAGDFFLVVAPHFQGRAILRDEVDEPRVRAFVALQQRIIFIAGFVCRALSSQTPAGELRRNQQTAAG